MKLRWKMGIPSQGNTGVRSWLTFTVLCQLTGLAIPVLGLLAHSPALAQVVKCVDAKGRIEYTKVCPPGTNEAGRIQRDATPDPVAAPAVASPRSGMTKASDVDPGLLNDAEDRVCRASFALASARSGLARQAAAPPTQPSNDPRERQLDQALDNMGQGVLRGEVASQTKQLANYQAEYRRLTGTEFNVAYCEDNQRRYKRQQAWDAKRRDDQMNREADQRMATMANEADGVKAICGEMKAMGPPPENWEQYMSAETMKKTQEFGRANYNRLVASYERTYNKRFDPARCR